MSGGVVRLAQMVTGGGVTAAGGDDGGPHVQRAVCRSSLRRGTRAHQAGRGVQRAQAVLEVVVGEEHLGAYVGHGRVEKFVGGAAGGPAHQLDDPARQVPVAELVGDSVNSAVRQGQQPKGFLLVGSAMELDSSAEFLQQRGEMLRDPGVLRGQAPGHRVRDRAAQLGQCPNRPVIGHVVGVQCPTQIRKESVYATLGVLRRPGQCSGLDVEGGGDSAEHVGGGSARALLDLANQAEGNGCGGRQLRLGQPPQGTHLCDAPGRGTRFVGGHACSIRCHDITRTIAATVVRR
jgi:hypothetical protein